MNLDTFFSFMKMTTLEGILPLNDDQKKALKHDFHAPLWMIAGPGTGKTHTLVWLVLKRMIVDRIAAEKIFLTTFTKKAAAELESRLLNCRNQLVAAGLDEARNIDLTKINIGTLHSLCSRILNQERYEPTLRVRALEDEVSQRFFLYRYWNEIASQNDDQFWAYFGLKPNWSGYLTQSQKILHAIKLFNRMTENQVNIELMKQSRNVYIQQLAQYYLDYQKSLTDHGRLDQAHLQFQFLQFLKSPYGKRYIEAGFTVLVDEFQDTNPIQEEIYFQLAGSKADLTVVGDDDQSLYRFRGATVESLIRFDETCAYFFNQTPVQVNLNENRRSHKKIIEWVNRFIEYHPTMRDDQIPVRAPGKRPITPGPQYSGNYPAVMMIDESNHVIAGRKVGEVIKQLMDDKMIQDYSQVALLSFTTRETDHGIKQYVKGLEGSGIPYYNPRNKSTQNNPIFLGIIGALVSILDPRIDQGADRQRDAFKKLAGSVKTYLTKARRTYLDLIKTGRYRDLETYVNATIKSIETSLGMPTKDTSFLKRRGGRRVTLSGILYKLLAFEPFLSAFSQDEEESGRLKTLNVILSEYEALFNGGELKVEWDAVDRKAFLEHWTLRNIYSVFIEGIHQGLNDPEDDEISIQPGKVNIMTIHQSKGLEFEVVFVIRPDKKPFVSDTHVMEDVLSTFVQRPIQPQYRSQALRAEEDAIRLFFVAYSRAKNLLVLAGSDCSQWDQVLGVNHRGAAMNNRSKLIREGVYVL